MQEKYMLKKHFATQTSDQKFPVKRAPYKERAAPWPYPRRVLLIMGVDMPSNVLERCSELPKKA
jgi:hypothetical protein